MNKKSLFYFIIPSLFLSIIPSVKADLESMILDTLTLIFGTGHETNVMILKVAIFIVLFSIISTSADKLFLHNKAISTIVALITSILAVRFIPEEIISGFISPLYFVFALLLVVGGLWLSMNNYFPIRQNRLFALIHIVIYSVIVWFLIAKLPDFITQVQNEIIANLLLVLRMWGRWIFILLILFALVHLFHQRLPPEVRERLRREREMHREQVRKERAETGERSAHEETMRRQMGREDTLERRKFERVQRQAAISRRRVEEAERMKREEQERVRRRVLANIEESKKAREASKFEEFARREKELKRRK